MKRVLPLLGELIWRDWLAAAIASGALPHPPIGTPSAIDHEGNSAPARAPVAGVWESERTGEHGGAK